MRKILYGLLTSAALFAVPVASAQQAPQPAPQQAAQAPTVEAALEAFDRQIRATRFNGSVLIAKGGKILLSRGYGMANLEWNIPADGATKYRVGSVTKQFTAAAILKLQERGLLSVDDSICKWVDPCPEAWRPVTLHHLLNHTGGVTNPTDRPDYDQISRLPTTPAMLVKMVAAAPLKFAPGTKWSYSNGGYYLLGWVIERVSGKPYAEFLRTEIFEPLGMRNSGYENDSLVPHRADGYVVNGGQMRHAAILDMDFAYSAGALYSTVEDLWIWEQALYGGKVLQPASLQAMLGKVGGKDRYLEFSYRGATLRYGYGIQSGPIGHMVTPGLDINQFHHGGVINGFRADMTYVPDQDLTVIAMTNVAGGPLSTLLVTQKAVAAFAGLPMPMRLAPVSPPAGAAPPK